MTETAKTSATAANRASTSGSAGSPRPDRSFLVHGTRVPAPPLAPGLYVVSTPIGNLADVTLRALAILAGADAILAEDTRVSRTLLDRYGIETPLSPYHEHNAADGAAAGAAADRRGAGAGAHFRRRDAADLRSRLQAGRRGGRAGPCRDGRARALGRAGGALRRRPAERPFFLRGVPAAEARGATRAHQRARRRAGHAGLLRSAGPARRRRSPTWRSNSDPGRRRWRAN